MWRASTFTYYCTLVYKIQVRGLLFIFGVLSRPWGHTFGRVERFSTGGGGGRGLYQRLLIDLQPRSNFGVFSWLPPSFGVGLGRLGSCTDGEWDPRWGGRGFARGP